MKKVNIIYLLPEMKGASGGAKVIYNHSLILNNLGVNISSRIIHLKKNFFYKLELSLAKKVKFFSKTHSGWDGNRMRVSKNFKPKKDWYENKILNSQNFNFDKKKILLLFQRFGHILQPILSLQKKELITLFLFKDFII